MQPTPLRALLLERVKPFLNVKAFAVQTSRILRSPSRAVDPERFQDSDWISPLTYAAVGVSIVVWSVLLLEIIAFRVGTLSDYASLAEAAKARAAGVDTFKLEWPLAFLIGSYVFKYILRRDDSPTIVQYAHEYHLQYVFALFLLPNLLIALSTHLALLDHYYHLPTWLMETAPVMFWCAIGTGLLATYFAVRTTARLFQEPGVHVWMALFFSNFLGFTMSYTVLASISKVTASLLGPSSSSV